MLYDNMIICYVYYKYVSSLLAYQLNLRGTNMVTLNFYDVIPISQRPSN